MITYLLNTLVDSIKTSLINKLGLDPSTEVDLDDFPQLIDDIPILDSVEELTVTENGTYTGTDGVTYNPVNVNLPLDTKTITANGTYNASDDSLQGYSSVTVDIDDTDLYRDTTDSTYESVKTLSNCGAFPMLSLTAEINAVQDLHGYDHPWAGGAGKNKANPDLLLNGYTNPSNRKYDNTTMAKTQFVKTEGLSTITISATNGNRCYVCYYNDIPNVGDEASTNVTQATSLPQTITVDSSYTYVAIQVCYNPSGANVSNVQVESGNQATTFAPYSNICPITGWDSIDVARCGKNWFDAQDIVTKSNHTTCTYIEDGYLHYNAGNSATVGINWYGLNIPCPLVFSGSVKNFDSLNENVNFFATFDDGTVSPIDIIRQLTPNEEQSFSVIIGVSGKKLVNLTNSWESARKLGLNLATTQLERGTTATPYKAYNGQTHTTALSTTCYGATKELISGAENITHGHIASYNGETLPSTWISDRDEYAEGTTPTIGAEVVYELATPTTATSDAIDLTLAEGVNNIWANSGDVGDARYFKKVEL